MKGRRRAWGDGGGGQTAGGGGLHPVTITAQVWVCSLTPHNQPIRSLTKLSRVFRTQLAGDGSIGCMTALALLF